MFQAVLGTGSASRQHQVSSGPHLLCDLRLLKTPNGCQGVELTSSAVLLRAPGSSAPPCPINFKCYSYPLPPPCFASLSLPAAFHHHLGAPSPISALSWLILSCNWTGVPGDCRQHAPVPHVPSCVEHGR